MSLSLGQSEKGEMGCFEAANSKQFFKELISRSG
jgi:hypothetical protein